MLQKKIIKYLLYWLVLGGIIPHYIWPSQYIEYVSEVLVFYLYYKTYKIKPAEPVKTHIGTVLPKIIGAFVFIGLISSFLNFQPLLTTLWGLRNYIRYFIVFFAIYNFYDEADANSFKHILIKLFRFNLLFILFETFVFHNYGDLLGGTFSGGNSAFYVYLVICMILISGDFLQHKIDKDTVVVYCVGCFYFALAGEVKIVYFTLPLLMYTMYVLMRKFNFTHVLVIVLAFFLLIPSMQFVIGQYENEEYANMIFTREFLEEETSSENSFGEGFNRSNQIEKANEIFLTDKFHFFIGYGFGAGSTSRVFSSDFARQYERTVYQYFSASYLLAETGWIGFVLFVLGHVVLLSRFFIFYRAFYDNHEIRYWTSVGIVSVLMTFIMMWYNNKPVIDYSLMYMFWAVCFAQIKTKTKSIRALNTENVDK